ncbi:MAG: hypothetical protein HOV71_19130 [Hamadaea sp.]|nr:hypothetical protein [Hamadaea sp.]NUR50245.1 hypothetical protein [Hamadaea sp.]NUR94617.1 hypothetical protein [Kribbellaceae bacterium]
MQRLDVAAGSLLALCAGAAVVAALTGADESVVGVLGVLAVSVAAGWSFGRDRRQAARTAEIQRQAEQTQAALAELTDRLKMSALALGRMSEQLTAIEAAGSGPDNHDRPSASPAKA